ncbi:S-methyl-5-thioribose-1-phosphate isomerase [bacterium]|nr:S-methyl-5-thioribose-1-phosphate isomerase [bacterium]
MFYTIDYKDNKVYMLDQRKIPYEEVYNVYKDHHEVAEAITSMVIRGAPAIGVAAAYGISLGANKIKTNDKEKFFKEFEEICRIIVSARPTAVNLFWAVERMMKLAESVKGLPIEEIKSILHDEALKIGVEDIEINRKMGFNGQVFLNDGDTVLTHCNAGALATAGYGTALGVIRAAVESGKKIQVFADETRPFLQGARLTTWELMKDNIPVILITDNMAGHFMKLGKIQKIVVGADRIASNGDAANKIGTYSVAVLAKHHNIPFYVAAPTSTIDMNAKSGDDIPIEQRDTKEVSEMYFERRIAPLNVNILYPAFDVTPNHLIAAIITEKSAVKAPYKENIKKLFD